MVVSPDVGGVARARAFAKKLNNAPLAIIDKRRQSHNEAEVMNVIGEVDGKVCVMLDDMIDTAGTINLTQTATWSAALCQYLSLTVLRYVFKRRSMFVMKVLYMWSSIRREIAARDL